MLRQFSGPIPAREPLLSGACLSPKRAGSKVSLLGEDVAVVGVVEAAASLILDQISSWVTLRFPSEVLLQRKKIDQKLRAGPIESINQGFLDIPLDGANR